MSVLRFLISATVMFPSEPSPRREGKTASVRLSLPDVALAYVPASNSVVLISCDVAGPFARLPFTKRKIEAFVAFDPSLRLTWPQTKRDVDLTTLLAERLRVISKLLL